MIDLEAVTARLDLIRSKPNALRDDFDTTWLLVTAAQAVEALRERDAALNDIATYQPKPAPDIEPYLEIAAFSKARARDALASVRVDEGE